MLGLGSTRTASTNIKCVINELSPPILSKDTVICLPFVGVSTTGPPVKVPLIVNYTFQIQAQLNCGAQTNIGGPRLVEDIAKNRFRNNLSVKILTQAIFPKITINNHMVTICVFPYFLIYVLDQLILGTPALSVLPFLIYN